MTTFILQFLRQKEQVGFLKTKSSLDVISDLE